MTTLSNLTEPEIEPQTSLMCLATELTGQLAENIFPNIFHLAFLDNQNIIGFKLGRKRKSCWHNQISVQRTILVQSKLINK